MNFWPWLRRKFFYNDWSRWPYRRRLRPWVGRVAVAVIGLGFVLGTIVFAVSAAGRDPFDRTNAATSTSTAQPLSGLAISERYSLWRSGLTSPRQERADAAIPSALAAAFVTAAKGTLDPGAKNLLSSLFRELLAAPGDQSTSAAAGLASIESLLPAAQQALLPAKLSGTMTSALDGVVHGGSEEFGKRAIDHLFDWLGRSPSGVVGPETVNVKVVAPTPLKLRLADPPPVKIGLTPTSFVWGGQTWEWGALPRFKVTFATKHTGETKACVAQRLVLLIERHPVIREVFAIATPGRRPIVPCH